MRRVLFATSEVDPLIKTGGLADVSAALPAALSRPDTDIRLILPATADALATLEQSRVVAELTNVGSAPLVRIHQGCNPGDQIQIYLVEAPGLLDRLGTPYGIEGQEWHDNAERFAVFAHAVVRLCLDQADIGWRPDVIHCNDWPTGLIPALLAEAPDRPRTVFTIHNLAYQGVFPGDCVTKLALPDWLRSSDTLEFHGGLSFMKAGLTFADRLTTVSPAYAEEIQTADHGCGLEGLLQTRRDQLVGITNGIDNRRWNPATDLALPHAFDSETLDRRKHNKRALCEALGLPCLDSPMVAFIGRLVDQKGIDLVLGTLSEWSTRDIQLVILGAGDPDYEQQLLEAARRGPGTIAVRIGFDDALARLIYGSTDILLMTSRFEPCGLNQLYAQRYGAVPVVHRTGGLSDTVVDVAEQTLQNGTATGYVFHKFSVPALFDCVDRALVTLNSWNWLALQRAGMSQDFGWERSVEGYRAVYAAAQTCDQNESL